MRRAAVLTALAVGLLGFWNCSTRVGRTFVGLKPNYGQSLPATTSLHSLRKPFAFCRGDFIDKRGTGSQLGRYQRELAVNIIETRDEPGEVLFQGLQALFTGAGHQWTGEVAGDLQLDLRLLATMAEATKSMSPTFSTAVQIQLDFVEVRTQQVVYKGTYKGEDVRGRSFEASFATSFERCIAAVGTDPYLVERLNRVAD